MPNETPEQHRDSEQVPEGGICPGCGKRRQQVRAGSITGWVFGGNVCKCQSASTESLFTPTHKQRQLQSLSLPSLGNRFEVTELIGIGGMGAVYKARDAAANVFAIKVLRADVAHDPHKHELFRREIEAAMQFKHANLVSIYGFGTTEDELPFAEMEFVDGKSLSQILITEGFMDVDRALDLFIQIADGVAHAHALGIVHLDLKPSNVIISKGHWRETAKVVDFGIARMMTADTDRVSQAEEIMGSLPYMSPEQCRGEMADFRSDVYSMGCLMYEALTGKSAFQGDNPVKTIMRHLSDRSRSLSPTLLRLDIVPELTSVVLHCLEPQAEARYQLMDELLKDLQSVKNGQAPAVAAQQIADRKSKSGRRVKIWQGTALLATALIVTVAMSTPLSARDTVTQMVVVANVFLTFMMLLAWVWIFALTSQQYKKERSRLIESNHRDSSQVVMLICLQFLLASLITALPLLANTSFVFTVIERTWSAARIIEKIRLVSNSVLPAFLIYISLTAALFMIFLRQRRANDGGAGSILLPGQRHRI